jgi:hypothetical protein
MSEELDQLSHEIDVVRTDLQDLQTSVDTLQGLPGAVSEHEGNITRILGLIEQITQTQASMLINMELMAAKLP